VSPFEENFCDRLGAKVRIVTTAVSAKPICEYLTDGPDAFVPGGCKKSGGWLRRKVCCFYMPPPSTHVGVSK
jgi:hypothetical protein